MRENVPCIRGSEENVLDRYRQAAQELEADVIVRVTGDAPLVDPKTIDRLVKAIIEQDADYAAGDPQTITIHEGFSPFSRRALDRLVAEASGENSAREHVTAYIKEHPESFRTIFISMPEEHRFEGARLSVDTPADLRFMEELYSRLDVAAGDADVADVVRLLTEHTDLLEINTDVRQKTAGPSSDATGTERWAWVTWSAAWPLPRSCERSIVGGLPSPWCPARPDSAW